MKLITQVRFLSLLVLALILANAHPGYAQSAKFTQPLAEDAHFAVWQYEPQGEMIIAVSILNAKGKLAVCGAWTISKRMSPYLDEAGTVRKSRENAKILVNGAMVMNSMRSFKRVLIKDFDFGTPTNCKRTRVDWHSSYSNESISIDAPWLRPVE